jgi:hypothetical protein
MPHEQTDTVAPAIFHFLRGLREHPDTAAGNLRAVELEL